MLYLRVILGVRSCEKMYGKTPLTTASAIIHVTSPRRTSSGPSPHLPRGCSYARLEQGNQHRWSRIRPILIQGPHYLLQSTLLVAVRFSFVNDTVQVPYYPDPVSVSVYDDLSDTEPPNNTVPGQTYIASSSTSRYLVSLGTSVWDVLTVGSAAATYRTNLTTIVLLCSPCPGQQDRVLSKVFQMVRMLVSIHLAV